MGFLGLFRVGYFRRNICGGFFIIRGYRESYNRDDDFFILRSILRICRGDILFRAFVDDV